MCIWTTMLAYRTSPSQISEKNSAETSGWHIFNGEMIRLFSSFFCAAYCVGSMLMCGVVLVPAVITVFLKMKNVRDETAPRKMEASLKPAIQLNFSEGEKSSLYYTMCLTRSIKKSLKRRLKKSSCIFIVADRQGIKFNKLWHDVSMCRSFWRGVFDSAKNRKRQRRKRYSS